MNTYVQDTNEQKTPTASRDVQNLKEVGLFRHNLIGHRMRLGKAQATYTYIHTRTRSKHNHLAELRSFCPTLAAED